MCNHCRSVRGNRRNQETEKPVRPSREIPADAFGCCQWRQTCCGGGCCNDVNCCGTGSSNTNRGYNTGYNYESRTLPKKIGMGMGMGMGMNYCNAHTTAQSKPIVPKRGMLVPGPINDEDTIPCVTAQKEKYCVGGDCYLDEDEELDGLDKRRETGQTSR